MKWPLVEVEWIDSSSSAKWFDVEQIDAELSTCISVGWLAAENKTAVTLLQNVDVRDGTPYACAGEMTIPKVAITKRRTIRKARKQ